MKAFNFLSIILTTELFEILFSVLRGTLRARYSTLILYTVASLSWNVTIGVPHNSSEISVVFPETKRRRNQL